MVDERSGCMPERVVVAVSAEDTPYCATGSDLVADRLFGLGASAVSEVPVDDGVEVRLVADLPVEALDELQRAGTDFDLLERDPSWSDGWQEHAVAVRAGEHLVVRPRWVAVDDGAVGDRTQVVVDAAGAFGSGSHPTTRLCLSAVERLLRPGDRVLDVGCGSGVLGVAALLLGAGAMVAVDHDPVAVDATRRTAELNGVADLAIEVSTRTVEQVTADHGPFDLVLANLLISVIEVLGPDLWTAVAPDGHLVLSGLLAEGSRGQVRRSIVATSGVADRSDAAPESPQRRSDAHPADVDVEECDGWAVVVIRR